MKKAEKVINDLDTTLQEASKSLKIQDYMKVLRLACELLEKALEEAQTRIKNHKPAVATAQNQ